MQAMQISKPYTMYEYPAHTWLGPRACQKSASWAAAGCHHCMQVLRLSPTHMTFACSASPYPGIQSKLKHQQCQQQRSLPAVGRQGTPPSPLTADMSHVMQRSGKMNGGGHGLMSLRQMRQSIHSMHSVTATRMSQRGGIQCGKVSVASQTEGMLCVLSLNPSMQSVTHTAAMSHLGRQVTGTAEVLHQQIQRNHERGTQMHGAQTESPVLLGMHDLKLDCTHQSFSSNICFQCSHLVCILALLATLPGLDAHMPVYMHIH